MPILFGLLGILLIISGWNNTYQDLGSQLSADFTGGGNGIGSGFLPWLGAIAALWMLSSVPAAEKPAKMLFALVVLVFVTKNNGVFANFQAAFTGSAQSQGPASAAITLPSGAAPISLSGSGGAGGGIGTAAGIVGKLIP